MTLRRPSRGRLSRAPRLGVPPSRLVAGASILGIGLGRDSQILTSGEQREGWAWPAFEERRQDAFRTYYRYVPKGAFKVEYTLRYNNAGVFELPATRVEALYAPEMLGELPNLPVEVKEAP